MKRMSLATKVLIGFIVGIALGLIFQKQILLIKPVGTLFLDLIKMIVVPLVFFSITSSVTGLDNIHKLKRIGSKTLMYYLVTTLVAGLIGITVANLLKPGIGMDISSITQAATAASIEAKNVPSLSETLLSMIPTNPFKSLAEGSLIQIIIFSLFFGVSLTLLGERATPVKQFFTIATEVMYKMTAIVMAFSPIGVAALIACSIGEYGLAVFGPLAKFILTDYVGMITVVLVIYILMLKLIAKVSLKQFFKKILAIWAVTASTTSSSGTLPVTINVTEKKLGVSNELAQFTLPLGATINMNGAVVYYSAAVIFVAQIYNVDLSLTQQLMLVLTASLISIGSPGIPGGGIVMTIMLLTTMGLPLDIVGLIAGMYRILDMGHTTLNVTGDVVSTLCIARKEGMLDDDVIKSN